MSSKRTSGPSNFRFARHSGPIKADGRESVLPIRIRVPRTCVWHCAADTIVIHRRKWPPRLGRFSRTSASAPPEAGAKSLPCW